MTLAENAHLRQQNETLNAALQRHMDNMAAIYRVAAAVGSSLNLDETLEAALEVVIETIGAEAAGISLIDDKAGELVLRAQRGWLQDFTSKPMRIPLGQGMSGEVISNDKMVVHNQLDGSETYAVKSFRDEHFRSIAMAPMHAEGRIIGILSAMSHQPDKFDENLSELLRVIADTVGIAIHNASLYEVHVEHETRLSAILQSTADGIIATNQYGFISLVNHAAVDMLEIPADDLIGMPLREAPLQPRVRDLLLLTLSSRGADEKKSFQVTLENERVLSVLVSAVQVESQVSQEAVQDGWVIVLQDVTHVREAEIARARFVRAAAHDMRNPLNVTQTSLSLLRTYVESEDDDISEIIDIAHTGIDRLKRLIDDLLQIEKIESKFEFRLSDVDIREVCREVSASHQEQYMAQDLNLTVEVKDDVPTTFEVDRNWLVMALDHYLDNARKFTPPDGRILVRVSTQVPMLHIDIQDSGEGIDPATQRKLFERFYRVDPTDDRSGSGLGLAIVKSIAEAHGGSVYVHSKVGEGSTFGIRFPLAQDTP